jgi:hypothetical protein
MVWTILGLKSLFLPKTALMIELAGIIIPGHYSPMVCLALKTARHLALDIDRAIGWANSHFVY